MDHEPIHVSFREERVQVTVSEERLQFSSPLLLAAPPMGLPCESHVSRVEGIAPGAPTTLDQLAVAASRLGVKWFLLLFDANDTLAVASEVNALRRGNQIWFTEFAVLGDSGLLPYDLDVVDEGSLVRLVLTSRCNGLLGARTVRIGIFN